MAAAIVLTFGAGLKPHPNDLDRKRIERALKARKRYRYVTPNVLPAPEGYRIESPCCSRNIDPEGGTIDVALVTYDAEPRQWRLHRKDHSTGTWVFHSAYDRLPALLDLLNEDEGRVFWQ
ncbi:DUF3024 domain-containing protein [Methylocapsa palsarum]|uniref:DUF3024 domain-containing protein n=1 Tax=Methylocapsa palsarum TaxID=1612308 RepID=A0A1I3W7U4_9HYPH|nr:DUF3024 domain-containing protein [Methylocapsa palsarum]SFK02526.1 Protein of unknown function [Methylocapsa palsarum]